MTRTVPAYAAHSADTPLVPFAVPRRAPRPDDVVIDILYCGVCHSDLHQARNDWRNTVYPVVPGHEIVGRVAAVGAAVSRHRVGDLVGVGCLVDSCRHCEACDDGEEQYCRNRSTPTYNGVDRHDGQPTFGGYSKSIVVSEAFVLRIPAGLDPARAAPLLCAGITSYSPLRHWQIGPGHRVAVAGLGGLGHMGLKLARAMGAEVTLFTRSPGKAEDARRLGAHDVVLTTDAAQMKAAASRFDFILDTVPQSHALNPYLATLKRNGTLVLVGLIGPLEETLHTGTLIGGRRAVAGSLIGGLPETQEMLDFCAAHHIAADVELIAMADIEAAYVRMQKSDVKYRFVIDLATLG